LKLFWKNDSWPHTFPAVLNYKLTDLFVYWSVFMYLLTCPSLRSFVSLLACSFLIACQHAYLPSFNHSVTPLFFLPSLKFIISFILSFLPSFCPSFLPSSFYLSFLFYLLPSFLHPSFLLPSFFLPSYIPSFLLI
jgi:hypothetical protein